MGYHERRGKKVAGGGRGFRTPLDKYRTSVYTGNRVRITRMLDVTSRWKVGQRAVSDRVRVVDEHARRSATPRASLGRVEQHVRGQ